MGRSLLCIDMDGVLARFHDKAVGTDGKIHYHRMYREGFFASLDPYENMVEAASILAAEFGEIDLKILSKVPGKRPDLAGQKSDWVERHAPFIPAEHRHFVGRGESKAAYFDCFANDYESVSLIDDYDKNLFEWGEAGGKSIKFVNGTNDKTSDWVGSRLYHDTEPRLLASELARIVLGLD